MKTAFGKDKKVSNFLRHYCKLQDQLRKKVGNCRDVL
jgi:hypothetical protein